MNQIAARTLPVLPLSTGVIFPGMVVTVALESEEAQAAARAATDGTVLLVPRSGSGFASMGVIAAVEQSGGLPGGTEALMIRGDSRAQVGTGVIGTGDALWVTAEPVEDSEPSARTDDLATDYRAAARALLESVGARRLTELLRDVDSPGELADTIGWWPDLSYERKIRLLEELDVDRRLELAADWAREALAERELTEQIKTEVTDGLEKSQREYLLRQQLTAIRKELGEDGDDDLVDGYRERLGELDAPDDVKIAISKEIDRLERVGEQNTEHSWIRTWLDTIFELPWGVRSDDDLDLARAREILDEDHTGLDEVKDRIVEFLAVRKLRSERAGDTAHESDTPSRNEPARGGAIVALVGPPGVGKTSLGESVARALGREFVRVALGGVRDEAEIRGHRRTYVGARPGRIARALTEAGTQNPVFLLDELDKVGADWRGDPSAALLEVLDPAQNHSFRDHYLEVDLDLSDVLFIATANVVETIPGPLLDRLEVIQLDGYTEDEKVAIARDHLLERQRERNALEADEVTVTDAALRQIVADYTTEAGVRQLERQVGKALRKAATRIADPDHAESTPVVIDVDDLRDALGRPRPRRDRALSEPTVGVATGLAVTGAGGDVLFVEATDMDGDAGLTLTGQLGDVMSESGQIALSYIRAHREELGIDDDPGTRRFHVHFPAGAVPKDGPSAGITMTTALASLTTGRPVRSDVGMTGEVTLTGNVLPIGGVKQKLLAAHRAGLQHVVIPADNEPDLDDLPESVLAELTVHPVERVGQVLELALAD